MSLLQIFSTRRRSSLVIPKIPCPLSSQIKNPTVIPKLHSMSVNYYNKIDDKIKNIANDKCPSDDKSSDINQINSNGPVVDSEISKVFYLSSNKNVIKNELNISFLPKLPSPDAQNFNEIFKEKIIVCNYIFDFSNPQLQISGKREKGYALNEISMLLSKKEVYSLLTSNQKDMILDMITKNVFEQEPFISKGKAYTSIIRLTFIERSWQHISLVFKILNQYVLIFPEKFNIDHVKKVIRLMNIRDSNERDCLVEFLNNYTKSHHGQLTEIFGHLKNALINVRYDIYTAYCVEPIISYMTAVFLSYVSVSEIHFFVKILYSHLLSLFENEQLFLYFSKLTSLIVQIIENRSNDQLNVIQYLIKHFPYQCGQKQQLFVSAIISIIQTMAFEELNSIAKKLINFMAITLKLPNKKLVESSLSLFLLSTMRPIIFSNYEYAVDVLTEPLKLCSSSFWDKGVKEQGHTALSSLLNAKIEVMKDHALCDFITNSDESSNFDDEIVVDVKDLAKKWASISRTAAKKDSSIDLTKSLIQIQIEFGRNEETKEPMKEERQIRQTKSKIERHNSLKINVNNKL